MPKNTPNQWGRAALTAAASTLALMTATPAVMAKEPAPAATQQEINILSGPLAESLFEVSNIFGVTIVAPNTLVAGKSAPAITGSLTAQQAVNRLLAGSGLIANDTPNGGFLVTARQELSAPTSVEATEAQTVTGADEVPAVQETIIVQSRFQQSLIDRIPIAPQELPFTLNTLDRELVDLFNFTTPIETVLLLPNVEQLRDRQGFGGGEITVRGYNGDVLINNRALLTNTGRPDDSFVDRFEVLKGPASIALGPVEPGGIVNIILKNPQQERFVGWELTTDQFGTVEAEFDVNTGPLIGDNVRSRISGAYRDFQFDADLTKSESVAIRGVVDADITPSTFLQASLAYQDIEARPNGIFPLNSDGSIPDGFDTRTFFGQASGDNRSEDIYIDGQLVQEFLDDVKLVARGSYQISEFQAEEVFPGVYNYTYDDGTAGIGLDNQVVYQYFGFGGKEEVENLFLDAQLSVSPEAFGQKHDFVIGASYFEVLLDDFDSTSDFTVEGPISISDLNEPRFSPIGDQTFVLETQEQTELASVYAEFAIRPTDWLSLIGGVRYDDLNQDTFIPADESDVTFRFGASAQILNGLNLYTSIAQSFAPQFGIRVTGEQVPPARGNSYEAGLKGALFDDRLNFDLTFFDTRRSDVSVLDLENSDPGSGTNFQTTIGEQRNRGIELSAQIRPAQGLTLDMNYGYIDIDVLEAAEVFGLPTQVPPHTFNMFGNYAVHEGPLAKLELGGGLRYASDQPATQSDIAGVEFPDYTVGDVRIAYPINDFLTASLNVINVTDELYLRNTGYQIGFLTGGNGFGEPRTFRFTLRGRF